MTMCLSDYLALTRQTQAAFGRRIGRSTATISRICNGIGSVDRETATAIFWETGGLVTPNDLYRLPPSQLQDAA